MQSLLSGELSIVGLHDGMTDALDLFGIQRVVSSILSECQERFRGTILFVLRQHAYLRHRIFQ